MVKSITKFPDFFILLEQNTVFLMYWALTNRDLLDINLAVSKCLDLVTRVVVLHYKIVLKE